MFKKLRRKTALLALALAFIINIPVSAQNLGVSVNLNGEPLTFDVPAMIINDRTMVPMRGIFETLDFTVTWNEANRTISAEGPHTVYMQIGNYRISVDGTVSVIDTPPVIIEGRTLIPLRALIEGIGCEVYWDDASRTVDINYEGSTGNQNTENNNPSASLTSLEEAAANIPEFSNSPYVIINNNIPYFTQSDFAESSFEHYSELDSLGRCGQAFANIGYDLMPTEERGSIGQIKPAGWHTVKYDFIDGKYLYNRCHLIGFQLTAENDNEKNLITGTRYLNVEGMLPFENMTADYIRNNPDKHVLYRVTPIYQGDNLITSGLVMEGLSTEDSGGSLCFCVYVYNNQPNVEIDYATGESRATNSETVPEKEIDENVTYIMNKKTLKFHNPYCPSVDDMNEKNKLYFYGTREEAIESGYIPCGYCKP